MSLNSSLNIVFLRAISDESQKFIYGLDSVLAIVHTYNDTGSKKVATNLLS